MNADVSTPKQPPLNLRLRAEAERDEHESIKVLLEEAAEAIELLSVRVADPYWRTRRDF